MAKYQLQLILILLLVLVGCRTSETAQQKTRSKNWLQHWSSSDYVEDSVITGYKFRNGSGLGGSSFTFNSDSTFEYFGFCDICPGTHAFGRYSEKRDRIVLMDTLCFKTEPHFASPTDTIPFEGSKEHDLYKFWYLGRLCLSSRLLDSAEIANDEYRMYVGNLYKKVVVTP